MVRIKNFGTKFVSTKKQRKTFMLNEKNKVLTAIRQCLGQPNCRWSEFQSCRNNKHELFQRKEFGTVPYSKRPISPKQSKNYSQPRTIQSVILVERRKSILKYIPGTIYNDFLFHQHFLKTDKIVQGFLMAYCFTFPLPHSPSHAEISKLQKFNFFLKLKRNIFQCPISNLNLGCDVTKIR